MHFRSRHLACLFLLLSSLGVAQGRGFRDGSDVFRGRYIDVLLYRHAARSASQEAATTALARKQSAVDVADMPQAARVVYRAAWTMQPAAAQAASIATSTTHPRAATL